MEEFVLQGRCVVEGVVEGEALVTNDAISFMGTVDPKTGRIIERKHEIEGALIAGQDTGCSQAPRGPQAAPTCSTKL